jgi:hypothetical protein
MTSTLPMKDSPALAAEPVDAGVSPLLEALVATAPAQSNEEEAWPTLRLPPGLHGGFIEAHDARDRSLRVTLLDGRRTRAVLASHVQQGLLEQCMAHRLMALLSDADIPIVVGVLQTGPAPVVDRDGTLTVDAKRIRLRASQELRLEAGPNSVLIEMDDEGKLKLRCERGVFDVAANLRIYSALVELP